MTKTDTPTPTCERDVLVARLEGQRAERAKLGAESQAVQTELNDLSSSVDTRRRDPSADLDRLTIDAGKLTELVHRLSVYNQRYATIERAIRETEASIGRNISQVKNWDFEIARLKQRLASNGFHDNRIILARQALEAAEQHQKAEQAQLKKFIADRLAAAGA